MVYVNKDSNTRTGTGHELEAIDLTNDHEEGFEICADDSASPLLTRRGIAPTNYLRVSKQGQGVEGQYVLDLSLPPPPSSESAPGALSDQDRKNLSLYTTSGSIDAEIWIIHGGVMSGKPKRASMELFTDNGVVRAIVHDPSSTNGNSRARPALDLNMRAIYGDISVSLPRCFRGPITISTGDDRIAFSPALEEYMSLISDVPGSRVYFVGPRPLTGKWGSGGSGGADKEGESSGETLDQLSVGGGFSSVRINWDGEKDLPEMKPSGWHSFCGGTARFFTSGRVC